jgi:hypothetical protein
LLAFSLVWVLQFRVLRCAEPSEGPAASDTGAGQGVRKQSQGVGGCVVVRSHTSVHDLHPLLLLLVLLL